MSHIPYNLQARVFYTDFKDNYEKTFKGQKHEKNRWPTFNLNQILFENKQSGRIEFLNILSCSRDIKMISQAFCIF